VIRLPRAARVETQEIGGVSIELQPAAMRALLAAREEAQVEGLDRHRDTA
jgi:hypothetical protein